MSRGVDSDKIAFGGNEQEGPGDGGCGRAMRTYDDDDEEASWPDGARDDDALDEGPDEADLAAENGPVRCVHCRRLIHGDADICPYCHHWQIGEHHPQPRPRWFVVTVILLVAGLSGLLAAGFWYLHW